MQRHARALGADRCLILQYDSASESLPVQYMGQYCAHSGIEPVQRDDLPSEAILYSLNGQIVSNAPCARLAQQIQDFNDRYGAQSSAAVQMVFRGAPMGMILTQQCDRLRVWDEDDMALLHTLAMELGGAFYLAELFRLTEQAGLEAATASERKNRALASFAHELRSPLHTVISCAELMKDDLFVQQPEKRREYAALSEKKRALSPQPD